MKVQFITDDGKVLSTQTLKEKVFKPNDDGQSSCGYNGHGKIELPSGERLQISLNLIAVGSREWDTTQKEEFFNENS